LYYDPPFKIGCKNYDTDNNCPLKETIMTVPTHMWKTLRCIHKSKPGDILWHVSFIGMNYKHGEIVWYNKFKKFSEVLSEMYRLDEPLFPEQKKLIPDNQEILQNIKDDMKGTIQKKMIFDNDDYNWNDRDVTDERRKFFKETKDKWDHYISGGENYAEKIIKKRPRDDDVAAAAAA